MTKLPIALSNLLVLVTLCILWVVLSPGGFELGKYKVEAANIRFTPASASYLQHDYVDLDSAQAHGKQFKDKTYPRRYNFNFDENEPVEGPKSIFIPSASDEAVVLFNGVPFAESEAAQFFAPGLGRSNIFTDIPRYALTPGNNRADIHYMTDGKRAGLREVFIGPKDRLNHIKAKQTRLFAIVPKIGVTLSLLACLMCLIGVLFGKFGKPFAILGGVAALVFTQFILSLDMANWAALTFHRQFSILLPLLGMILLALWWFTDRRRQKLEVFYLPAIFLFAVLGQLYGALASIWPNPMPGVLSGSLLSLTSILPLLLIWPLFNILTDLSERRSIIQALSMQVTEQEKLLDDKSRVIATEMQKRAVLEERQRFTRDIHDGIGGQLLSLLLKVRSGRVGIEGVANEIQAGINDLRLVVDAMDHTGDNLNMALATFKARTERQLEDAEIKFVWELEEPLAFDLEATRDILNLYRLMQEAVSNAIRHGKPDSIRISIAMEKDNLRLTILDDGKGFDVADVKAGKGLTNMKSRAERLGAELVIVSEPGSGTELQLSLKPRA